jgi:hypothetical protein
MIGAALNCEIIAHECAQGLCDILSRSHYLVIIYYSSNKIILKSAKNAVEEKRAEEVPGKIRVTHEIEYNCIYFPRGTQPCNR